MNVSLTKELVKLVEAKVASGFYGSASEVIREALRLLQKKDEAERIAIEATRAKINEGLRDAKAGRVTAFDKKGLRARISEIKSNGRAARRDSKSAK